MQTNHYKTTKYSLIEVLFNYYGDISVIFFTTSPLLVWHIIAKTMISKKE